MYIQGNGIIGGLDTLPAKILNSSNLQTGAVNFVTPDSSIATTMFTYANTSGSINMDATFSLTEAQAPIGSYVIMSAQIDSGSHASDHYLQLYQVQEWTERTKLSVYTYYWFYNQYVRGIFPITSASDRNFHVHHGTVTTAATGGDSRRVHYHGYILLNS